MWDRYVVLDFTLIIYRNEITHMFHPAMISTPNFISVSSTHTGSKVAKVTLVRKQYQGLDYKIC